MYLKVSQNKQKMLAIFSEVNSSPQLFSILMAAKESGILVDVLIFSVKENPLLRELRDNGINVRNIRPSKKINSGVLFLTVACKIFRQKPDILFTSGIYANIVGLTTSYFQKVKRRVFIRHHSNFHSVNRHFLGMLTDRLCNKLATDIVAVSKLVEQILVKNEKVSQKKVKLIHNGINLSVFKHDRKKVHVFNDPDSELQFRIGMVSRMTKLKGISYAAEAFVKLHEEFPHATFTVIGQFSDSYTDIKQTLEKLPLSSYQLRESTPSVSNFLSSLDAFIHVPIGIEDESFGLVYLEALASNVECIFTVSGILNELPNLEKYVSLVDYKSANGIYQALHRLLENVDNNMLVVPEIWLSQFDLEQMSKKYVDLFVEKERSS